MKILQINKYFYKKGGADIVFLNTIRLLEQHGHTVIPFSIENERNESTTYSNYFVDYSELSESGIFTKMRNIFSFIYNRRAAKLLEQLILTEKPDIAHIHLMFNSLSVSILPVLKKYNIPIVMSLHDHRLICPAYLFIDGKGNICEKCLKDGHYWHCITNRCSKGNFFNSLMLAIDSYFRKYFISPLKFVDKFIFVGEFAQKKHISFNPVFEQKSTVLHNFTTLKNENSSSKDDYILYFGRVSEEKGISVLIEAMKNMPDVKLKIIGTGALLEELSSCSYTNIEFIGYKTGEELYNYVQKTLFVIVPSTCYENNPMAVIESFALGTPVIASNIGGVPELIQDCKTGYLVEPNSPEKLKDAIKKGLNLPSKEYAEMCRETRIFAGANFTEDAYYPKLIAIYNDAIQNNIK